MTRLALWLTCCLAFSWLVRRRPIVGICAAIALWFAVPAIASYHVTGIAGGTLGFHPSSWLLLTLLGVQVLWAPRLINVALARHIYLVIIVVIFIFVAFITSRVMGTGGTRLLMDQIISPGILFVLVVAFARDLSAQRILRNTLLAAAAAECVLAIAQSIAGNILIYSSDYETLYWFNPMTFDRWMGTSDSPLVLSMAICVAAAFTIGLENAWIRSFLLMLFLIGTILTQSRTGAATMAILLLFIIFRASMTAIARTLYVILVGVAGYFIVSSTLAAGLTSRFSNDSGSSQARGEALQFFADHWTHYLFSGGGLTSSYSIAGNAGLITSLESSYLMYAIDVGILLATLYFGAQVLLVVAHIRQRWQSGAPLAALIGIVLQHMFSAIAGTNLSGTVIWLALGLTVVGSSVSVAQSRDEVAPGMEMSGLLGSQKR